MIKKVVPPHRVELRTDAYKATVIPFNYRGNVYFSLFLRFSVRVRIIYTRVKAKIENQQVIMLVIQNGSVISHSPTINHRKNILRG